jgi:UDP-galactopyranose mutase
VTDVLVVGAGFAGSVVAERLATAGRSVLVIDRRSHIGGNAFDEKDDAGVLVHRYGPHIFHTNSDRIADYLSRFTAWRRYEHRVLASVRGSLVPIPINRTTINTLFGTAYTTDDQVEAFFEARAESHRPARNSEDVVVGRVGRELYELFFRGYSRKQWGLDPTELDPSVTARIPTRTGTDDRYFTDRFQAMPADGYTRLFQRLLDHRRITVSVGTDFADLDGNDFETVVYTGPIDEYFGHRFGRLPYRSLRFEFETHDAPRYQPVGTVNYPDEATPYTRITEFKHLTGQRLERTTIVREYPRGEGEPYYPIPRPQNAALYERYRQLAAAERGVFFVGRLATYRYHNMDQVVGQALMTARKILEPASARPSRVPAKQRVPATRVAASRAA